jgi:hypothetical protein
VVSRSANPVEVISFMIRSSFGCFELISVHRQIVVRVDNYQIVPTKIADMHPAFGWCLARTASLCMCFKGVWHRQFASINARSSLGTASNTTALTSRGLMFICRSNYSERWGDPLLQALGLAKFQKICA